MLISPSMTITTSLRHFSVTSPEEYTSGNSWDDEPPETGWNYAWVKARTKREAKILAVKAWGLPRKEREESPWLIEYANDSFGYCDYRALNPFKGLKVKEISPCPVHGFEPEEEPFVDCTSGVCLPYQCTVCGEWIEPLGSEVAKNRRYPDETGLVDELVYFHPLCSLPEHKHAEAVYGDEYFA